MQKQRKIEFGQNFVFRWQDYEEILKNKEVGLCFGGKFEDNVGAVP